jgi:hypothetical protein
MRRRARLLVMVRVVMVRVVWRAWFGFGLRQFGVVSAMP